MSVSSCCVPGRRVATSGSTGSDSPDSPLGTRRVQTTVRAELTSHQYKVWLPLVECSSSQTTLTLSLSFCPCFCHCASVSVHVHLSLSLSLYPSVPISVHVHLSLSLSLSLALALALCHCCCPCLSVHFCVVMTFVIVFFLTSCVHLVCESTFSFFSLVRNYS